MKRWIVLILIVALIVPVLLAVPVSAASLVLTGNADLVGNAIFYLYDDGFMDIQGSGILTDYSSASAQPWYSQRSSIASVSFSEGITEIGTRTFFSCSVSSVSFPSTLTKIGTHSFRESSLTSVVLPPSLKTIGGYVFYGCQSLTDVYFTSVTPPVLLKDNIYPFYSCPNLVNMYVPEGSLDDYVASFPSSYHAYLKEAPPLAPTVPEVSASFAGQTIYMDSGSIDFYISATNVNGELSCQYYINGEPFDDVFTFQQLNDQRWLQAWKYTPVGDGVREIYAIVTNTVNGQTASIATGTCKVIVGNVSGGGSGGDSSGESGGDNTEVVGKLDSLEQDVQNLQGTVDSIGNKVDGIQGTVNDMAENVENLPDDIQNGMQNVIDGEKENATNAGGNYVDQILDLVPNESQGFIDSMGSFVSTLSYNGVDCVLSLPAVNLPAIPGLFSSCKLMDAQQIDFGDFFDLFPTNILLLVQSLFTIALIVYCFKELYSVISYFLTLKGDDK